MNKRTFPYRTAVIIRRQHPARGVSVLMMDAAVRYSEAFETSVRHGRRLESDGGAIVAGLDVGKFAELVGGIEAPGLNQVERNFHSSVN